MSKLPQDAHAQARRAMVFYFDRVMLDAPHRANFEQTDEERVNIRRQRLAAWRARHRGDA
eukprot:5668145-Alexandrium_andersonii.AAC.1